MEMLYRRKNIYPECQIRYWFDGILKFKCFFPPFQSHLPLKYSFEQRVMRRDPSQTINQMLDFVDSHHHDDCIHISLFESIQHSKLYGCSFLSSFLLSSWLPLVIFHPYDYILGAFCIYKNP